LDEEFYEIENCIEQEENIDQSSRRMGLKNILHDHLKKIKTKFRDQLNISSLAKI